MRLFSTVNFLLFIFAPNKQRYKQFRFLDIKQGFISEKHEMLLSLNL